MLYRRRKLTAAIAGAILALTVPLAAQAAPRDFDRSFGGDGIVLTALGAGSASARSIALQPDGRILAAGDAEVASTGERSALALARYRPGGLPDGTFGGGDGSVIERFTEDGNRASMVARQPDGKILVAGSAGCCFAAVHVTRYLASGTRDTGFGDGGVVLLPGFCCDSADATGLAVQPDGKIVVAGWINNTDTSDSFVARLTPEGDPDEAFGDGGVTRLELGDRQLKYSRAHGLVLQGDRNPKIVIAGDVFTSDDVYDVMLARLDSAGELDETFGDGGVVQARAGNDDNYSAADVAAWDGKLVVTGIRGPNPLFPPARNYLLARFDGDHGELDTSFNSEGTDPGWVFAGAGDSDPRAEALAVNPANGSATIVGRAVEDGKRKLLVARYTSEGIRDDATFRTHDGRVGARLIDAGDGGQTLGHDVLLDAQGKIVAAGSALDGGRQKFLLVRLGDTPPKPNLRPVARIRGHHIVPRKHWERFSAGASFDRDGRIVDYAWRTGRRPFRSLGPVFWHRFGRVGLHRLELRVTDDRGARSYAKFFVSVRKGGGQ